MRHRIILLLFFIAAGMSPATTYGAQYFLYVANGNISNSSGVSAYTINPATGEVTAVTGSPFPAGTYPVAVAVDPTGQFAYVADRESNGNVYAYTINPATGALTAAPDSPFTAGDDPVSVTVDPTGQFVYVVNQGSNNISAYTINHATGGLTAVAGSPFAAATSPVSVTVDPTGQFAYVGNQGGASNVSAYTINPATGVLTAVPGSPFPAGSVPQAVTTDPTGQFLYTANEGSNTGLGTVSAYAINPSNGALTNIPGSPFPTGTNPWSLTVDPTGQFVYVANYYSRNVSGYAIDPTNGTIAAVPGSPFAAGLSPCSVAVDPTGQFTYVGNGNSYNISEYTINSATGGLGAVSGSPFAEGGSPCSVVTTSDNGPALNVAMSHAGTFMQGQSGVTYIVTVSNTGAGSTTGVVTVTERVPVGLTLLSLVGSGWTCPSGGTICTRGDPLAAGTSYPTVTVTMDVVANAPASVINQGSVATVGSPTAIASDPTTILVPVLNIGITQSGNFTEGQTGATYSITVTNSGTGPTGGTVTVNETVPAGLTLISMGGSGWTCPAGGASCYRSDPLDAGTSYPTITVTVNVATNALASVTNQASVSCVGSPTATTSDPTPIIQLPVLTVSSVHTGDFAQGQVGATYSIIVTNSGSAPTTGIVTVTESAPSGLTLVSIGGTGWTCPSSGTICTRADSLASGASYLPITVTVNVATDAPPLLTNQVSVSGGSSATATDSDPTIIPQSILAATKVHTGNFTQGQNGATYTVVVSNNSNRPLVLSTNALSFGNVTGETSQGINITASGLTIFTAVSSETTCTGAAWLQFASGSYTAGTVATSITVTVDPTQIAFGSTCYGLINLTSPTATQIVTVSMSVDVPSPNVNVIVNPLAMTFTYTQGQTVPTAQTATIVNAASGAPPIPFTLTTAVSGQVGNWLQANVTSALTPYNNPGLSVSVTPGGLGPGTYQGTVTIQPTGGAAQPIDVTLTVLSSGGTGGAISAAPGTIAMTYVVGGTSPTSTIQVSGGWGATFSATAASTAGWLQVSPTSGTEPLSSPYVNLTVYVVPSMLAGPGLYEGTITVTGTNWATGTTVISVTLTVVAAVTVTENVPSGLTLVSMVGSGWTCPAGGNTCTRNDLLNAGASYLPITVTVNVATNAPAAVTNQVSVSGGGSATATASDPTRIIPLPSLSVTKSHTGDFTQGQTSTYTVTVSNGAAAGPTSGTVTVTENIPSGLTLLSMEGDSWTCPRNGTSCSRNDSLSGGATYSAITVMVNVANNAPASVTNEVSVSGGNSTNTTASDPTTINSHCDVNQYGTTTVADVQQMINEALGVLSTMNDLNGDGVVNVVDVQIVANAALGLACWAL